MVAVLQAARTQGLLDDLDSVVAAAASPSLADSLTPAASGAAADRASVGTAGSSVGSEDDGGGGGNGSVSGCAGMRVPLALLQTAMTSRKEALRLDALQLVTGNPRMTSLPGSQAPCIPALPGYFRSRMQAAADISLPRTDSHKPPAQCMWCLGLPHPLEHHRDTCCMVLWTLHRSKFAEAQSACRYAATSKNCYPVR